MKGSAPVPLKSRGWRGLVVAVLALVLLSMLVPFVFLLGLRNGFHSSAHGSEGRSSDTAATFQSYDAEDKARNPSKGSVKTSR